MVGFDSSTIINIHPAFKLTNQPNPADLSLPQIPDLSVTLVEDFDFIDDWIVDNDPFDISMEGTAVAVDGSDHKHIDFLDFPNNQEKIIVEESGLGSLIEQEMGKVSLVGASQSEIQEPKDSVVEGSVGKDEVTFSYEVLGELKAEENVGEDNKADNSVKSTEVVIRGESSSSSSSDSESVTESESESDSSSSSSCDEDEDEEKKEMDGDIEIEEGEIKDFDPEEILLGSDEDEPAIKGPIKSKNEIEFLPPVPPVNVTLEPHHKTLPVGVILSIMGIKVVVEGLEKHNPLNEGSILWITENRSPLGLVDEIFGPVKNPYYIVRYNSDEDVPPGISVGTPISFVADFADHVLNDKNLYKKGYDASGENDEEISEEVEFSDDEKEAEYRRAQKMANKGANDKKRGNKEFGNQKKNQRKGSWKNSQTPAQGLGGHISQTNSPNEYNAPAGEASVGCSSSACSYSTGPPSVSVPSPALQTAHANCFTPQMMPTNGVWTSGMPGQMQQNMMFPNGFLINGMPVQQLNQFQQPPQQLNQFQQPPQQLNQFQQPPQQLNQFQQPPQQLNQFQQPLQPVQQLNQFQQPQQPLNPYPSGMPFQQFNPSQMPMPNMALPYVQPNFSLGSSMSWPGNLGQSGFNQAQFGMGSQGLQVQQPVNAGQSQDMSSGSLNAQNHGIPSPSTFQGNFPVHHQQNQGRGSTRGRRPYRRGGRFSGGRGRQ